MGPDYGICDVYVNGMLWQGFDNYAASAGEDAISLALQGDGPHVLEVKNRAEKNRSSSGYKVAFKQLVVEREYDLHTIQYGYDGLSRLLSADYFAGDNVDGTAFRQYGYTYDLAGNRTQEVVTVSGTPTTTNYTYNAANQISNTGFAYDDAGRMTSDGVNTYTWDRATRLLSMGGISYAYDGLGDRISQTANSVVTNYLNDVQPGLTKVLAETKNGNTIRYGHGPRGIQAIESSTGSWQFPIQDGLGSVRAEVDASLGQVSGQHYAPYGAPFGTTGTFVGPFGFTGEQTDGNSQVYLRARYYNPDIGVFSSLDPFEGIVKRSMSLNGYSWVEGNSVNASDPSGNTLMLASVMNSSLCSLSGQQADCSCYGIFSFLCPNFLPPCSVTTLPTPAPSSPISPTTTPPCSMREKNGVNVLAATAIAETDGGGSLFQSNEAVIALMLMQANSYRAGNWRQLGTFERQNRTPLTIVADQSQTRIINLANLVVEGYCQNGDALSQFTQNNYPGITNNDVLAQIAENINARFEISIDASRAEQFRSDPAYPLQFVITAPGANKAIVIGDANITNAWLRYQCPAGQAEIMRENPANMMLPYTAPDELGKKYSCGPCSEPSHYWVANGNGEFGMMTSREMYSQGKWGYGASCQ